MLSPFFPNSGIKDNWEVLFGRNVLPIVWCWLLVRSFCSSFISFWHLDKLLLVARRETLSYDDSADDSDGIELGVVVAKDEVVVSRCICESSAPPDKERSLCLSWNAGNNVTAWIVMDCGENARTMVWDGMEWGGDTWMVKRERGVFVSEP